MRLHAISNSGGAFASILALAASFSLIFSCVHVTPSFAAVDPIAEQLEQVKKFENSNNKGAYADALFDLACRYNNRGDLDNALKYFQQSLAVEQTLKRPEKEVEVRMRIGLFFLYQNKLDEALSKFNEAIQVAQANKVKDGVAGIDNNIGIALLGAGKIAEAEQHFKKALSECPPEEPVLKSTILRSLASLYDDTGRYDEAIKYVNDAAQILAEKGDEGEYGITLTKLAQFQNDSGRPLEATKTYEKIVKDFDAQIFPDVLAHAEYMQGDNLYERQRITDALQHYSKALNLARDNKIDDDLLLKCLIGYGIVQADLEHFSDAVKLHAEAVDLAGHLNKTERLVDAETQLAGDYLIQGNPERALMHLMKALTRCGGLAPKVRGKVLTGIGRCYAGLGQRSLSAKYYQEAISLYDQLQNYSLKALAMNSLAVLYLDAGEYPMFDEVYGKAKLVYDKLPPRDQAKFEYNYAQSKLMRGQYGEAEKIYADALSKVADTGDEGLQSSLLRGLGTSCYFASKYQDALNYYAKALDLSKDCGSIEIEWDCKLGVGKALKALKKYDDAEPHLKTAVALVEKERSNLTRDSFKTYNLDLRKDCFQELVDLYVLTQRPYDALEVAERGKARAFLDMLANRRDHRIASVEFGAPKERAPLPQNQIMVAMAGTGDGTRSVQIKGKDLDDGSIEETAISPVNAAPPTIDEIKALVANRKSTTVEFLLANNRIYTWVVHPDGSINMPAPQAVPQDFQERIRDLLTNMTKQTKTASEIAQLGTRRQAELRSFYSLLIKPVEQYLPKNKDDVVTIVPHNVLFCIPFAALMNDNGDFLVEQHTLSYAPAIGVLRATQQLNAQHNAGPDHKLLAIGNPITERIAFLGKLPYAEKEVKHIAQLFGDQNVTMQIGEAATKDKFEQLVPNASEIHLATHGLVDEEHPMKSALVLAPTDQDDGMLTVRDIITLKNMHARMVVLSACQTGRGKITGDGVVGLSRAFIIAGAPSVLVSQWNVDDIMTEFQMEKFYRYYLKGEDRAKALRDAQLATIQYMETGQEKSPGSLRANPRYWAAFQLIGEI